PTREREIIKGKKCRLRTKEDKTKEYPKAYDKHYFMGKGNILGGDPLPFASLSPPHKYRILLRRQSSYLHNITLLIPFNYTNHRSMALKAVHVSDVPNLDQVPQNASLSLYPTRFCTGLEVNKTGFRIPKFVVIGHRGQGMNQLQSTDLRMRAIKENSITSFNSAATYPIDFVEFDVQ
ncbi:GDPD domain-containing protein, partial [Cephalotus follicularis]